MNTLWAARLEDHLHENVSEDYTYKGDPLALAFLKAIKPGADLSLVNHQIHIFIQQQNLKLVSELYIKADIKQQVADAINAVINLHQTALDTGVWDAQAAEAAAWAEVAANDRIADRFLSLLGAA